MQELRDQQLEQDIIRTLRFDTLVTPSQQQTARERLLQRVAEQTVLPPTVEPEAGSRLIDMALVLKNRSLKLLHVLILDSTAFDRVPRKPTHSYGFLDTYGRFTRPILTIAA